MFWIRYWPEAEIIGENEVKPWGKKQGTNSNSTICTYIHFKYWRQRLPWFVRKTKALQFIHDQIGILHSAEWIWARPDNEDEVSPAHVICAKELGDVQLSKIFWTPFQREVHYNVIISRQTWEDLLHCVGGEISLLFVWLGHKSYYFFAGVERMKTLALFLTWCMKTVREWVA